MMMVWLVGMSFVLLGYLMVVVELMVGDDVVVWLVI